MGGWWVTCPSPSPQEGTRAEHAAPGCTRSVLTHTPRPGAPSSERLVPGKSQLEGICRAHPRGARRGSHGAAGSRPSTAKPRAQAVLPRAAGTPRRPSAGLPPRQQHKLERGLWLGRGQGGPGHCLQPRWPDAHRAPGSEVPAAPAVLPGGSRSMHAFVLACVHAFVHTCVHAVVHTCVRAFVHPCMHSINANLNYALLGVNAAAMFQQVPEPQAGGQRPDTE